MSTSKEKKQEIKNLESMIRKAYGQDLNNLNKRMRGSDLTKILISIEAYEKAIAISEAFIINGKKPVSITFVFENFLTEFDQSSSAYRYLVKKAGYGEILFDDSIPYLKTKVEHLGELLKENPDLKVDLTATIEVDDKKIRLIDKSVDDFDKLIGYSDEKDPKKDSNKIVLRQATSFLSVIQKYANRPEIKAETIKEINNKVAEASNIVTSVLKQLQNQKIRDAKNAIKSELESKFEQWLKANNKKDTKQTRKEFESFLSLLESKDDEREDDTKVQKSGK